MKDTVILEDIQDNASAILLIAFMQKNAAELSTRAKKCIISAIAELNGLHSLAEKVREM